MRTGLSSCMPAIFSKIEIVFPNASGTSCKRTSAQTPEYNCIAWAAGENNCWWEPGLPSDLGYYWPSGATEGYELPCLIEAYQTIGYEVCKDDNVEIGFEKVAVYGSADGRWTHAARQLSNGAWTSKIGRCEDIEHEHPDHLECQQYGSVYCYMKRPLI